MNAQELRVDLGPLVPELLFAGGLLVLLILNVILRKRRGTITAAGGTGLLALVFVCALGGDESIGNYLFGSLVMDGTTMFFRVFFSVAAAISLGLMMFRFAEDGEPFLLLLSSVMGMFVLAAVNDLVALFVALELVSIPSYVLAGYRRYDVRSGEAALKYVLYGALSSGLMLFGFSFLYGLTGSTQLEVIASRLNVISGQEIMTLVALLLVLAGIGYKIAMVPLHFWCPDVYEGSPTAVTAFFSVVPKAAGFAALLRLLPVFLPLRTDFGVSALSLFTLVSALTMTFGNLGAIWQTSLKRLLAYSSIAHAGYLLMGFAVLAANPPLDVYQQAYVGIQFYLVAYLFMNLGAFLVVELVEQRTGSDSIVAFRGLGSTNATLAVLLSVFLFSLTGIPPLAGFTGKFLLFAALVKAKQWLLAMFGIANTVVSLYYYVRIIRDMFLVDAERAAAAEARAWRLPIFSLASVLALVTAIPTLVLGLWWGPLAGWILARAW